MGRGKNREDRPKLPSIYVGNLPEEKFYDLDFYKFFTSKGYKVQKAKVVLDKKTSKPLGYGYLNFHTQEEADRCLREMNNTEVYGRAIRLLPQGTKSFNEKANVIVKNVEKDVTQQQLFNLFNQFGGVQSCKLESYPDGTSRGFAYVQFETEDQATQAIEKLDGHELNGKKLEVVKHEKREARADKTQKYNNLFVKNLPKDTDDNKLRDMFKEFGEIESVHVQRDDNNNLKDYGFVAFKNPEDAEKAQDAMNKKPLTDNQFLIVNRHISKRENELSGGSKMGAISQNLTKTFNSNVYVKFIPNDISEEEVKKTFSQAGNIISMRMDKCKRNIGGSEVQLY